MPDNESQLRNRMAAMLAILKTPKIALARPAVNLFLMRYMGKFPLQRVGGNIILHSHLPPVNSKAFARFVNEQLVGKSTGPSHAQIGLTNACPQHCSCCYSQRRTGRAMDTETIVKAIRDLKRLGVFWLGFTGGEPLLNRDIVRIIASVGDDCAVKLFTTGCGLTKELAAGLQKAGLYSVSVSLDHQDEAVHDMGRGYQGAYRAARRAIDTFLDLGSVHVGVSAVLTRDMINTSRAEDFLGFLEGLGIHEAWLSEAKPSAPTSWDKEAVITERERLKLVKLQDRYNREGKMTVNYLGHFEGREHFGCNAGRKMVYVDAFGEVGPCVFTPMTFGNLRERPLAEIVREMRESFPPGDSCFINDNFELLKKYHQGRMPLGREETLALLKEARFGPPARFFQLHDQGNRGRRAK
ncbi:MAG: radical SAM/SPASM domain-containing protein [Ignavibacteriales bacterium]